jgi:transglutaminase-like putative cysteine protease
MLRRLCFSCCLCCRPLPAFAPAGSGSERAPFQLPLHIHGEKCQPGERVRVWIPLAHSDAFQDVTVVSKSGDLPLKQVHQPEYRNEVLYAETSKADKGEYKFSVDYDVVRREHVVLVNGKPLGDRGLRPRHESSWRDFLRPDRLVPVTGVPAQLAAQETSGATTPLEKAKDIYEYVFRTMKYDKSGEGWGHGDTLWACDSKHGNCTDFHSVFISMARAEKIPARFEIGFPASGR